MGSAENQIAKYYKNGHARKASAEPRIDEAQHCRGRDSSTGQVEKKAKPMSIGRVVLHVYGSN